MVKIKTSCVIMQQVFNSNEVPYLLKVRNKIYYKRISGLSLSLYDRINNNKFIYSKVKMSVNFNHLCSHVALQKIRHNDSPVSLECCFCELYVI